MPIVGFFSKNTTIKLQNEWEKRLRIHLPSIKLVPLFSADAEKATSALIWKAPLERLQDLNKLKGLISLGQGVDHILKKDLIPKKIPIVRIVDPYMAKSMSHWVILSILNFVRDTYGYYNQEKIKLYKSRKELNFLFLKVGIYGVGAIGSVVAKDLYNLGFKVEGWSRTKKEIEGVNCNYGENSIEKLIKNCDIHVCLLPLTPSTTNIFNKSTFAKMRRGSCFINAGRGEHVVEDDLIENCKSGHISSAILDVYRNEPLPKDHKLWEQKNIRIWPHVAAETNPETAAKQIANAIKCIDKGEIPPNTVDRNLGY